jgi:hypothetical protein
MTWKPLSARDDGSVTDVEFAADGSAVIRTRQEVGGILDHNKLIRDNDPNRGWRMNGDWRLYASIPNVIVHKWLEEGIDIYSGEQQDALARKLNDPDWAYLRTANGRIGVSNGVAR